MPTIAGAVQHDLLCYVRFRERTTKKNPGGIERIIAFDTNTANAEPFVRILKKQGYKKITYVLNFVVVPD